MQVSEQLPQGTSKRSAKMASIPLSLAGRGADTVGVAADDLGHDLCSLSKAAAQCTGMAEAGPNRAHVG